MATHRPTYTLADLRADLEALDAHMAADAKKRRKLAAAVAALEALEGPKKKPVPLKVSTSTGPKAPEVKPLAPGEPMPIADAAAMVLREAGRALNATEILKQINARALVGREIARTSVVAAMDRKYHDGEMFDKPKPGTYELIGTNGTHG